MQGNISVEDRLISELHTYLDHICFVQDLFDAYASLINATNLHNEAINLSPGFFRISQYALSKCLCLELAKLYDRREQKSVYKLIDHIRSAPSVFMNKRLSPDVVHSYDDTSRYLIKPRKINIAEDVKDISFQISTMEKTIKILLDRRDLVLAHNDRTYFDGKKDLATELPLTMQELQNLINLAGDFCNKMLFYLGKSEIMLKTLDSRDLDLLLQYAEYSLKNNSSND